MSSEKQRLIEQCDSPNAIKRRAAEYLRDGDPGAKVSPEMAARVGWKVSRASRHAPSRRGQALPRLRLATVLLTVLAAMPVAAASVARWAPDVWQRTTGVIRETGHKAKGALKRVTTGTRR